jgi:hypothetical protein
MILHHQHAYWREQPGPQRELIKTLFLQSLSDDKWTAVAPADRRGATPVRCRDRRGYRGKDGQVHTYGPTGEHTKSYAHFLATNKEENQ